MNSMEYLRSDEELKQMRKEWEMKFTEFSQKISTHLLTVLTIGAMVFVNRNRRILSMKPLYLPTIVIDKTVRLGRRNPYEHSKIYTEINRSHQRV